MSEAEPHNADASIKYNHALLAKGGVLFAISAASMFWWHKFDSKKARTVAALTGLGGAFHVFRGIAPSQELLGSLESLSGGGSGGASKGNHGGYWGSFTGFGVCAYQ